MSFVFEHDCIYVCMCAACICMVMSVSMYVLIRVTMHVNVCALVCMNMHVFSSPDGLHEPYVALADGKST